MPPPVPTVQERLAALEVQMRDVLAEINGGNGVAWDRSIRGRLHAMQSALASAELLRKAAEAAQAAQREAEKSQEKAALTAATLKGRRWSRLTQALVAGAAIATAAFPYLTHYVG